MNTEAVVKSTRSRLAEIIGAEKALLLMRTLGGHRIPRVTALQVSREERDANIRSDLDAGFTYLQTATRNSVSVYTVWKAAQRPAPHTTI